MATFDGPARAIRFAHAIFDLFAETGATMRAGVQSGEVVLGERGVTGLAVDTSGMLAGLAAPGQILATGTVRDLVAGSGIRYDDANVDLGAPLPAGLTVLSVDSDSIKHPG